MNAINSILQFANIFMYAILTLTLIKRVICRGTSLNPFKINWKRFKVLFLRRYYYSDILLLIYCIGALCNHSNKFLNYRINPNSDNITFFWELMHIILCTSLLIRFRHSKPEIINHLQEDIVQQLNKLKTYVNTHNFWIRQNKTGS